ncbi:hypothetical protein [Clostridium sp. YIM B02555]|uniref:ImmA/IrrE family metallo-endopeptidase n=1 Tax=Clostridium sp. YIM B02555 TaxID=2911968 RepID=UPI001EEF6B65|nr:hypothetical protein [Clostridium sp. YIM B02555]
MAIYPLGKLNGNDKLITCDHELGHALIHKNYNCAYLKTSTYTNVNELEKQTDIFSSLFETPIITEDMLAGKTLV